MLHDDLPVIMQIAEQIHPDYPEHIEVFKERLQLYPYGCWVRQQENQPCGYLISHPWQLGQPPTLDSLLQALPQSPDTYYLHDIALLPAARGSQAANQILVNLCRQAASLDIETVSLIAVNRSMHFWQQHDFEPANHLVSPAKLSSYDSQACYMVRHLARAKI